MFKLNSFLAAYRRSSGGWSLVALRLKSYKRLWIPAFAGMTMMLFSLESAALEIPHSGHFDRRVKHINYNPQQVVKLVGHYGFSTDIEFANDEMVKQIAMGDSDAWAVTTVANHIFIKPKAQNAVTNMTVLNSLGASNRVYNFELSAHWSRNGAHPHPNDMMFQVQFVYPHEQRNAAIEQQQKLKLAKQLNSEHQPKISNADYWYKGDENLLPNSAFDDGRFTYLTFNRKQDLPAIYIVNADDSESLVNANINPRQPDTIVVRRIVKQLVLRRGNQVLCLFNRSFKSEAVASYSTTTIPNVSRKIKMQAPEIQKGGK